MNATSNNPQSFAGKHYWPSDYYSVPADGRCFHMAPSPNSDHWCVREAGHAGRHQFEYSPIIRDRSWKDARPSTGGAMDGEGDRG